MFRCLIGGSDPPEYPSKANEGFSEDLKLAIYSWWNYVLHVHEPTKGFHDAWKAQGTGHFPESASLTDELVLSWQNGLVDENSD